MLGSGGFGTFYMLASTADQLIITDYDNREVSVPDKPPEGRHYWQ